MTKNTKTNIGMGDIIQYSSRVHLKQALSKHMYTTIKKQETHETKL